MDKKAMKKATKDFQKACAGLTMALGAPGSKIKAIFVNKTKRLVIVRWVDDTTTKVQCQPGDDFSVDIGVSLAYCYKFFGSKTKFRKAIAERVKEVE